MKCPECETDVSSAAVTCPKCGYPISNPSEPAAASTTVPSPQGRGNPVAAKWFGRIMLGFFGFTAFVIIFAIWNSGNDGLKLSPEDQKINDELGRRSDPEGALREINQARESCLSAGQKWDDQRGCIVHFPKVP